MPSIAPWRPDRWQLRENPEPGVLAALYDTDYPEQGPVHQLLPDPESPAGEYLLSRNLVREETSRHKAAAAQERQRQLLTALNDRFVLTLGNKTLSLSDNLKDDPAQVKTVLEAKAGWDVEHFTFPHHGGKEYRREDALNILRQYQDALNLRPAPAWHKKFADRYLQQHPYPDSAPKTSAPPKPAPPEPGPNISPNAGPTPSPTAGPAPSPTDGSAAGPAPTPPAG